MEYSDLDGKWNSWKHSMTAWLALYREAYMYLR